MGETVLTHRDIIDQLGGYRAVAAAVGLKHAAVCRWFDRGIPALYWPKLERLAKKQGHALTVEDLEASSPDPKLQLLLRQCAA